MENNNRDLLSEEKIASRPSTPNDLLLSVSVLLSSLILASTWIYTAESNTGASQKARTTARAEQALASELAEKVLPSQGVVLPVVWGDLGAKLVDAGAIDADKFKAIYVKRGSFTDEYQKLLLGENKGKLRITAANSGYLLNLFWALGLATKNPILDSGEMANPAYGGAKNFASTGGWTIAKGGPMDHYSKHTFFNLTPQQQALVEKVSKGIYRPCCGNSVHFPDCNHGMAMLGLLELMASQGVSEQDMWKTALTVNAYWFPNNYLTIATYMKNKGIDWKDIRPEEILGANYSSAQGYAKIASHVAVPAQQGGGGGCGIDAGGGAVEQQPAQGSCGI